MIFERVVDIRLAHAVIVDQDLSQKLAAALLLAKRCEELRCLELLIADEDLSEAVEAPLEYGDLVLE